MPAKKDPKESNDRDLQSEIEKTAKLFDVAKPGKTPASATSRPIIVKHSSTLQKDPMVKDGDETSDETAEAAKVDPKMHREKIIVPPGEEKVESADTEDQSNDNSDADEAAPPLNDEKAEVEDNDNKLASKENSNTEESTSADSAAEESVSEDTENTDGEEVNTSDESDKNDKEEPTEETDNQRNLDSNKDEDKTDDDKEESQPESSNVGVVDSLVTEVSSKKAEQKAQEAADAKQAEAEKIIESKEYFVPIGQATRRKNSAKFLLLFIFLVLLTLIGLNFAVDGDILDIGIPSYTDFL